MTYIVIADDKDDVKAWHHHKHCMGMSKQVLSMFVKSDEPFLCLHCVLSNYKLEIENLKKQVSVLYNNLAVLENQGTQADTMT